MYSIKDIHLISPLSVQEIEIIEVKHSFKPISFAGHRGSAGIEPAVYTELLGVLKNGATELIKLPGKPEITEQLHLMLLHSTYFASRPCPAGLLNMKTGEISYIKPLNKSYKVWQWLLLILSFTILPFTWLISFSDQVNNFPLLSIILKIVPTFMILIAVVLPFLSTKEQKARKALEQYMKHWQASWNQMSP